MGLLAKAILCFLLIHLSLSSGSGYEQRDGNNVEEGRMMVRINRRLSRGGGGGSRGGGRSSSPSGSGAASKKPPKTPTGNNNNNNGGGRRVPVTGGIYGAGAAANHNNNNHHSMSAPFSCYRNNIIGGLAVFIVAIFLATEF
ncbi:hypothetical protein MKX01_012759 [Papaver californicum]|nr:hypothetical protein MKX01_012759 [Papaver californicum]